MTGLAKRIEDLERGANAGERVLLVTWDMPERVGKAICEGYTVERKEGEERVDFRERALSSFEGLTLCGGTHWVHWE
ncbi:hypothetical protein [uncultured Desulfovibrio sp.]|uniref:hypothetical protein n=1 Tax=uncultured Desulfovibrio sp. TaxID=167968 RepID=UPI00262AEE58|nr:hypothetical protein [uncultured Desulfovibrio sp.]